MHVVSDERQLENRLLLKHVDTVFIGFTDQKPYYAYDTGFNSS